MFLAVYVVILGNPIFVRSVPIHAETLESSWSLKRSRIWFGLNPRGFIKGCTTSWGGAMDPLSGVGPEHLGVEGLIRRCRDATCNVRKEPVREVVLGLNPTLDGDTTALHLANQIEPFDIRVTRLARGLPSGGTLEQASVSVLADAMDDRRPLSGGTS